MAFGVAAAVINKFNNWMEGGDRSAVTCVLPTSDVPQRIQLRYITLKSKVTPWFKKCMVNDPGGLRPEMESTKTTWWLLKSVLSPVLFKMAMRGALWSVKACLYSSIDWGEPAQLSTEQLPPLREVKQQCHQILGFAFFTGLTPTGMIKPTIFQKEKHFDVTLSIKKRKQR